MNTTRERLLTNNFHFTANDNKTHVAVPFLIEREVAALYIRCRYSPKTLDDMSLAEKMAVEAIRMYISPSSDEVMDWKKFLPIHNLITLSVDYIPNTENICRRRAETTNASTSFSATEEVNVFEFRYGQEYVGCAHRHDPVQQHVISAGFASPGFERRRVLPGRWRAVLSVHAAYVPVDYELIIEAGDMD